MSQYEPAIHGVHVTVPVVAEKKPIKQLVHKDDWVGENLPTEQLVQKDEDATEYEPPVHAPVTAERPVVSQYEPAMHDEHVIVPVVAE